MKLIKTLFKLVVFIVLLPIFLLLKLFMPVKLWQGNDAVAIDLMNVIEDEHLVPAAKQEARMALKKIHNEKLVSDEMAEQIKERHGYLNLT